MAAANPVKYSLNDLTIGMEVDKDQLSNIYDTWIILYRPNDGELTHDGIIGFIGPETNPESDKLFEEYHR